jgi:hypothetical protein
LPVPLAPKRKKLFVFNGLIIRLTILHICTPFMEYGQAVFEMASIISVSLLRLRDRREKREKVLNIDLEFLTIALNKPVIFFTALTLTW